MSAAGIANTLLWIILIIVLVIVVIVVLKFLIGVLYMVPIITTTTIPLFSSPLILN